MVPVLSIEPAGADRCGSVAGFAGRVGTRPQSRIRRVQLGDFGRCSPGQIFLAGLGEKFKAGVW